jgi:hypothetical protein
MWIDVPTNSDKDPARSSTTMDDNGVETVMVRGLAVTLLGGRMAITVYLSTVR